MIDSIQKEELIAQGIFKLTALKASNLKKIQEGKTNELNFIVNLDPDNTTDYINDSNLPNKSKFLSATSVEQQLNNRLQQVFTDNYKECYLILINAFDVEIKAPVPSGLSAKDVFNNGKFFNEQSDIETLKTLHNDVVSVIAMNSSITTNNRDCYILSIGAYCGAFYTNKLGCYHFWFPKKVNIPGNATVQYFEETYNYLNTYLKNSNDFKHPDSRDNMAEQVVTAFESAAKNAELKAQILSTHTSPDLENILVHFTNAEDYSTLSIEERIHILKVFLTSLTFSSSETYINNTLRTTPAENVNDLLNGLLNPQNNINGTCLLTRLFSGIQGDNYTTFIKDICHLVGRSSLDGHNLPTKTTDYGNLQPSTFMVDENWHRTFEWTDCWNRLDPSNPNNPENVSLNPCNWTDFEKRFSNVAITNEGNITISGAYDSGKDGITAPGDPPFSPIEHLSHTYHPYDLIVFANKSDIESINEANTKGVVVVPALFLKFAYDKAFNQGIYDVAYINMSILGLLGVDEIMLASKALTKVSNLKSLLKWMRGGKVISNGGILAQSLTGFLKSSYDDLLTKGFSAVEDVDKIKFLDNTGRHLVEISNEKLMFKYGGYGGDIIITEGKATTVLGKFEEPNDIFAGTRYFLGSNNTTAVLGFPNGSINRGVSLAAPNRLNFLDLPEPQYNTLINSNIKSELEYFLGSPSNIDLSSQSKDNVINSIKLYYPGLSSSQIDNIVIAGQNKGNEAFWNTYNLSFWEQAFQRGDDIRLVSDPTNILTRTGSYKRELEAIENTLAQQYNYSYNPTTNTYYKN